MIKKNFFLTASLFLLSHENIKIQVELEASWTARPTNKKICNSSLNKQQNSGLRF